MHLNASPHKVHSVDTLHSDALVFLRIQVHSDAFTHTRIITDAQCVSGWKSFDRGYLETLLEKVTRRTFRANGTRRRIVAGTRIQPTDDTVEEEGDGEESEDEDLDGM